MLNNEDAINELKRAIAKVLREANGNPDKACELAYRYWDCGEQIMEVIHQMIRTEAKGAASKAAAISIPLSSTQH